MSLSHRDEFIAGLGFAPDDFQIDALDAVDGGRNVLVSAPTGAGKTLVADYAVTLALRRGGRAFYTTPLKALSNQKFGELCRRFGGQNVGLLTGDTSINREAPIVVMTTEVLRNMLLTGSDQVAHLTLVVLDEVHFLQDPWRGGVWEEVIILTPSPVQFVALSATVGNADFLGAWLSEVRGPTDVVVERERPITLHNHMAVVRRGQTEVEIMDLLENGRLSEDARKIDAHVKSLRKIRPRQRGRGPVSGPPVPYRAPRRSEMLRALDAADLLPAIVFIFSRAACDEAAQQVSRDGLLFTSPEQRRRIEHLASLRVESFSDDDLRALEFGPFLESLRRGIAAHHAGMVPAFREIVEACFEENLLGVVFATETLALGVNMPARSVVLERFTKYSDAGRQTLTSGEYAQLTGRAGRRGLDDEGHAIVSFANETSLVDVARVAAAPPGDLHSSFRPTYNFTANLINHVDQETALRIVHQSFAQFEATHRPSGGRRSLEEQLLARARVLSDLGYATGWQLTEQGQLLRSLYHECDLLVAETLAQGVLTDLEPSQLAGILSCFVYEGRRAAAKKGAHAVTTKKRRVVNDRLGQERRDSLRERFQEIVTLHAGIMTVEESHHIRHQREPDMSFATIMTAWARGATLGTVLDLADIELGLTAPGDFVRNAKQVADLCEQVGRLSQVASVANNALAARDLVLRSVVAGAAGIPHDGQAPS